MAQVRFISDLHFNHENMSVKRLFATAQAMNEHIIEQWNKVVHKKDVTYILGDITMEKSSGYELLDRLNGIKHVILGNHDRRQDIPKLLQYVNSVAGAIKYKKEFMLTHIPIHPTELYSNRVKYNIHGHVHDNTIKNYEWCFLTSQDIEVNNPNYINVCAEVIDYTPKTIKELLS